MIKVLIVAAACAASTSAQYPAEMQCALAWKTAPPGDLSTVLTPYGRPSPCHSDNNSGGGGGVGGEAACPAKGQVIVKVNASSVNPVDWKVFESNAGLPIQFPHILGFDLAGTVVECPGCTRLKVGDEVWGDNGALFGVSGKLGAYAQWTMSDEKQLGLKPASYSFVQAAAMPLVGLTSLQAFQKTGAPWKEAGTNVFITAGAGGTGHVAIQMAKAWGGNVTAVGGPRDEAFILQMGADRFIDYTKDANVFATVAADSVDVVYDNYGGAGTADQAMPALRQGGAFVFLPGNGGALSKHPKKGVKQINFGFVDSTKYADLDTLKVLADGGKLKPHLQAVFPMAELVAAFNLSMSGTVQGKIGIQIPGPPPPPPPPGPAEKCYGIMAPSTCNAQPLCWWFTAASDCAYCPEKQECKTYSTNPECTANPYCTWTGAACEWEPGSCPSSARAGPRI